GIESKTLAITLDRPQFFDTDDLHALKGFTVDWDGPFKIRFYADLDSRICYCSFIVFPTIQARVATCCEVSSEHSRLKNIVIGDLPGTEALEDPLVRRVYATVSMELAWELLRGFIRSGVADAVGIDLRQAPHYLNAGQFRATFGRVLGAKFLERT